MTGAARRPPPVWRVTRPEGVGAVTGLVAGLVMSFAWLSTAWAAQPGPTGGGTQAFWYVARATGFTAYVLLFMDVWLGLLLWGKDLDSRVARWRIFDLHQFTALLGTGFVIAHVVALRLDPFIGFTTRDLLVPLSSPYRPLPTALGVVGAYLFLLIVGSFYVRRLIGHRVWRGLHYSSFLVWLLVLAHGIFAGTDTPEVWARAIYGVTGLAIGFLMLRRFTQPGGAAGRELRRRGL